MTHSQEGLSTRRRAQFPPPETRFANRVDFDGPGGCWEWQGPRNQWGYGQFYADGHTRVAHRWGWERWVGPVPKGLQLDHLCRNRACVNPDHLEPVTPKESVRRSPSHCADKRAITHCPQGHEYTPENTRLYRGCRYCRTCHRLRERARRERKRAA